nr:hypothetical protein Iba_chr02aCG9640 [Ipomoea batatas]GMC60299.1 hypothetical protein Iba_chr02bCG9500 [Ipomoea batatas]
MAIRPWNPSGAGGAPWSGNDAPSRAGSTMPPSAAPLSDNSPSTASLSRSPFSTGQFSPTTSPGLPKLHSTTAHPPPALSPAASPSTTSVSHNPPFIGQSQPALHLPHAWDTV